MVIRSAVITDIPFVCSIAKRVYKERYRPDETPAFVSNMLNGPDCCLFLGNFAFGCAVVKRPFWEDSLVGYQLFLAALPNKEQEGLRIAERLIKWAGEKGAKKFVFSSDMGRNFKAIPARLKMPYVTQELVVVTL